MHSPLLLSESYFQPDIHRTRDWPALACSAQDDSPLLLPAPHGSAPARRLLDAQAFPAARRADGTAAAVSHGKPRVDDRRVPSGIIFVDRNGLRWRDAPKEYGPARTLCNRWKRWGDSGVFARMMTGLARDAAEQKTIMIDATRFRTDRTASSLAVKKAAWSTDRAEFEGRKTVRGLFSRGREA